MTTPYDNADTSSLGDPCEDWALWILAIESDSPVFAQDRAMYEAARDGIAARKAQCCTMLQRQAD